MKFLYRFLAFDLAAGILALPFACSALMGELGLRLLGVSVTVLYLMLGTGASTSVLAAIALRLPAELWYL